MTLSAMYVRKNVVQIKIYPTSDALGANGLLMRSVFPILQSSAILVPTGISSFLQIALLFDEAQGVGCIQSVSSLK